MATYRKRGESWQVQVRVRGHKARTATFQTKAEAIAWGEQTERTTGLATPSAPKALLSGGNQNATLESLIKFYLETITPTKRSGKNESYVLKSFLREPFCKKTIDLVTVADFFDYRSRCLEVMKPQTFGTNLCSVNQAIKIGLKYFGLPKDLNPITKCEFKRIKSENRERRLDWSETCLVIATARKILPKEGSLTGYLFKCIWFLALEFGVRRGDILNLLWADVYLEKRYVYIRKPKCDEKRQLPASKKAVVILKALKTFAETEYVFPISDDCFNAAMKKLKRKVPLHNWRFHDTRHEAISHMYEIGLTSPEVKMMSGHITDSQLGRYSHAQRSAIIRKLDAA